MAYYIEAIRAAAAASSPRDLKPALDFLLGLAIDDYKAGALDVVEFGDILNEYNDVLMVTNAAIYQ